MRETHPPTRRPRIPATRPTREGRSGCPPETEGAPERGRRGDQRTARTRRFLGAIAFGWLVMALAATLACTTARPPSQVGRKIESGIASWYGPKFHGRRTANGEVYDMFELTAAHKELPFGTVVEVRSLDTGKSIQVRINDRGPFVRGRIIDLSRAAADAIDMIGPGTAKVELYLVSGALREVFTVQVAAFRSHDRARELAADLGQTYEAVRIDSGDGWHRVQVGSFSQRREAVELQRRLRQIGHRGTVKGVPPAGG